MGDVAELVKGELRLLCPACHKRNAVPVDRAHGRAICGECKVDLPPVDRPVQLDDQSFAPFIRTASLPVLVDFRAPWYGSSGRG